MFTVVLMSFLLLYTCNLCSIFFCIFDVFLFFFFKQKTAYEMRISDWSSDVCSSDLLDRTPFQFVCASPYRFAGSKVEIESAERITLDSMHMRMHPGAHARTVVPA